MWPLNHVVADPETATIYAGGGNDWFGPAVWRSTDLGASWTHSSNGLRYATGEPPVVSVSSLAPHRDRLYAGVADARTACSDSADGGATWPRFRIRVKSGHKGREHQKA